MVKLKTPKLKTSSTKYKKRNDEFKSLGLFDHVNQITQVQDSNYFKNLSDSDKKSFNHFIILRALSMNPNNLNVVSMVFRYFDVIPSEQLYKVLISLIQPTWKRYKWIKPKKRNEELIRMISKRFEVTDSQAEEYINLLYLTKEGMDSLIYICQEFGKSDKEIKEILSTNNDDE